MLQIAPDREAMGEDSQTETLLDAPTHIMAKLVWDRLLPLEVPLLAVAWGSPLQEARDRMPKNPKMAREALQIGRTPVPSNVTGAKVQATWLGNVPPQPRL